MGKKIITQVVYIDDVINYSDKSVITSLSSYSGGKGFESRFGHYHYPNLVDLYECRDTVLNWVEVTFRHILFHYT